MQFLTNFYYPLEFIPNYFVTRINIRMRNYYLLMSEGL